MKFLRAVFTCPCFAASLCLAVSLTACASGGGKAGEIRAPSRFTGFPPQAFEGIVFTEARFYLNHDESHGDDLIEDEGVVPVALKIGLRGEGQNVAQVRISPEDMEFSLYLPDGTPLHGVDYQKVKPDRDDTRDAVVQEALKGTLLEAWERTHEGFVYFRLPEGVEYSARDHSVTLKNGDVLRSLDLTKALCTFKVTLNNQLVPFHVGVQQDRRATARAR